MKDKFIVFVGSKDEANDPNQYSIVMKKDSDKFIRIIEGGKHLDADYKRIEVKLLSGISAWVYVSINSL